MWHDIDRLVAEHTLAIPQPGDDDPRALGDHDIENTGLIDLVFLVVTLPVSDGTP